MAACRKETQAYRQCLKEKRSSGRSCDNLAKPLESCRERFRTANQIESKFDGTRVLPSPVCKPLNLKMQRCLAWRKGDEGKCKEEIKDLEECMGQTEGVVVEATKGDKLWSDYKRKSWRFLPGIVERRKRCSVLCNSAATNNRHMSCLSIAQIVVSFA